MMKLKVKVMFNLEQATKVQRESMGIAPRPDRFTPEQENRFQSHRRLGGPWGPSERVRKISPRRDSTPGPSSPQRVAIPTELFWP